MTTPIPVESAAPMRILLATQYFSPEITAAPIRLHPFAAGLARRGHDVTVLCEVPNHPRGVIEEEFRGRPLVRRVEDGFRVDRVWVRASPAKRARARLASYGSYAVMAALVGSLERRPEVILASSPPLSVGAVGSLLAARFRVPWVFDVRDLWPEAAVVLGELGPGRALRFAEWLERRLYRSAAAITTPTEPFRADIAAKAGDPDKVSVVPNGTTPMWLEAGREEVDRASLGLPADRFLWTYAGNMGLSQALDVAVEAAGLLDEGFQLLLVGEGAARARLERKAAELPGGAVAFRELAAPELAARYMRASDALLVPLADEPALGKSVPIKLYDCCAVGRPVIVAAPGEPRRLAEQGAGLALPPEDPRALADAVRRLSADPGERERLAAGAREFAERSLREHQVERLEGILESARPK